MFPLQQWLHANTPECYVIREFLVLSSGQHIQ